MTNQTPTTANRAHPDVEGPDQGVENPQQPSRTTTARRPKSTKSATAKNRKRHTAGKKVRERMCAVSRETLPETQLIRIAISPDDHAIPDLAGKLPGRGIWLRADKKTFATAIKKNAIARSAGQTVNVPSTLAEDVEALLAQRCLAQLGLARRRGHLVVGFDQVIDALRREQLVTLIEARDGAQDGRKRVINLARSLPFWAEATTPPLAGCFTSRHIGETLGRASTVHAGLRAGPHATGFCRELDRLSGFRPRFPLEWAANSG